MKKNKIAIMALCALVFSANTFAEISGQEQKLREVVSRCITDIQYSKNDPQTLDVQYGAAGGAYKYCSSAAAKTRQAITPGYNQQEAWDAEFLDLYAEYKAIPKEQQNSPEAQRLVKKIRVLTAPDKLDGRHPQSKLNVYRSMMKDLDKLDTLLVSIENTK